MNVAASLDLSRQLYELSGWEDTPLKWVGWTAQEMDSPTDFNWRPTHHEQQGFYSMSGDIEDRLKAEDRVFPAYDLGYLLRKLTFHHPEIYKVASETWRCKSAETAMYYKDAHTPEDAAARLAIELFKAGVLKRQAES